MTLLLTVYAYHLSFLQKLIGNIGLNEILDYLTIDGHKVTDNLY